MMIPYEKICEKRFFVSDVQQSVSAVNHIEWLVRVDCFRDIRDFETDLINDLL